MSEYNLIIYEEDTENIIIDFLELLEKDDIIIFEYKKNDEIKYNVAKKILESKKFVISSVGTTKYGNSKIKYAKKCE